MENIVGDQVSLPAGTPILIVGFMPTRPIHKVIGRDDVLPDIVLAGRLLERYSPGHALLLLPGPLARSVGGRGFRHLAFDGPAGAFTSLRHKHFDELGAYLYLATEDRCRIVEVIEQIERCRPIHWPEQLPLIRQIARHVDAAYHTLDPVERCHIAER